MKSKIFILALLLIVGSFTKAQIYLDSGLVACYPFAGNAMDSSGNGNHGTVNGAVLAMDRFGNPNSAYSFDGIDDFIEITNSVIPSKEISVSFWSKANQLKSHFVFMLVPNNQSDRMSIVVNYKVGTDAAIFWDFGDLFGSGRLGDSPLPFVNVWEHYVCIASQSKDSMMVYRDGVLQKGVNYSDIVNDTNKTLRIGSGDNYGYFDGLIDDIMIYNRALTIAEVQALYNGASCIQCESPIANFSSFDTLLTASFTDSSQDVTNWLWDFGDGSSDTIQNPTHVYDSAGIYDVCLIASNYCGPDAICYSITITCPLPIADFTYIDTNLTINFGDTSTNITNWYWDYGDGDFSTLQNPTHTYTNSGIYYVCLTVTNSCGSNLNCDSILVLSLGIKNYSFGNELKIIPNPFSKTAIIEFEIKKDTKHTLTIYNMSGQIVQQTNEITTGKFKIEAEDLTNGLYFFELQNDKEIVGSGKIIIE